MKRRILSGALLLCVFASLLILPANAAQVMHCRIYDLTISGVPSGGNAITEENSTLERAFDNDMQYICSVQLEPGKTYFLTCGSRETDEFQNASPSTAFKVYDLGAELDTTYGFGYCLTAGDNTSIDIINENPSIYKLYEVTQLIRYTDYRKSSCQSDLEYFGFTDFPTAEEQNTGDMSFVHVAHCFEAYYVSPSVYGLFFYIYNPSGVDIRGGSIRLATSFNADGTPAKYDTFALTACGGSEKDIYKLRLDYPGTLRSFLSSSTRIYAYSGLTLNYNTGKVVSYDNTGKFTFSGSDFDSSSATVVSLSADAAAQDALVKAFTSTTDDYSVKLDIGYTYYRTDTSYQGAYHHNQIDSIYFAMPTYLENHYGELTDVELKYWKARTNPIFVFDDKDIYDSVYWNAGKTVSFSEGFRDPALPLVYSRNLTRVLGKDLTSSGLNIPLNLRISTNFVEYPAAYYAFLVEDCSAGFRDPRSTVSGESIISWIRNYKPYVLPALKKQMPDGRMYYPELFASYDSSMTTLHTSDLKKLVAASYADDHNFFEKWGQYGLLYAMFGTSTDKTVELTQDDMIQTIPSRSSIASGCDRFYYAEKDIPALEALYDSTGKTKLKIVHFNVSDYYQEDMYASFTGGMLDPSDASDAYVAQEDIYFDLHVLSLGLEDESGKVTRVQAESTHIDAAADISDEKDPDDINDQAGSEAAEATKSWFSRLGSALLNVLKVIGFVILAALLIVGISKLVSLITELIRRYKDNRNSGSGKESKPPEPKNDNRKE